MAVERPESRNNVFLALAECAGIPNRSGQGRYAVPAMKDGPDWRSISTSSEGEHHLPGLSGEHGVEALLEFVE